MPRDSTEYPPLLAGQGLVSMSLDDLKALCVDKFPASKNRARILGNFCEVLAKLSRAMIACEVWVDGSYLTNKLNPRDIDFVVRMDGEAYNHAEPWQRKVFDEISSHQTRYKLLCHGSFQFSYPPGHKRESIADIEYKTWLNEFGESATFGQKGIAVLRVCPNE